MGLQLDLQHDLRVLEVTALGELINKAKAVEEVRGKIKAQDEGQRGVLGKRSYNVYEPKKFEAGSSSGPSKKFTYEKPQNQGQGQGEAGKPRTNGKR